MPINHDDITASVYVSGVSLGCVNPYTKKWEVAFIRERRHTLVVEIIKCRHGKPDKTVHEVSCIQPNRIIIEADQPVFKETSTYPLPKGDPEYFGLLLDIEKKVYRNRRIKLKKPTYGITEMYVSKAKLYAVAGMLSPSRVRVVRKDAYERPLSLGKIGTTAGADIKCRAGGHVFIAIDGPGGFQCKLRQEDGSRYIIRFDNRCPRAKAAEPNRYEKDKYVAPHSDFVLYYDVIEPEDKGHYDLEDDVEKEGEGAVCNYSELGKTEWMFPLPITEL